MTDGWNWRRPEGSATQAGSPPYSAPPPSASPPYSAPPSGPPTAGTPGRSPWPAGAGAPGPGTPKATAPGGGGWAAGSAGRPSAVWWSDALGDPWRDPYTPAAVVVPAPPVERAAEPEPVVDPDAAPRRGTGPVFAVALVVALLAGMLGGAVGYAFAVRGGVGGATTLGAM